MKHIALAILLLVTIYVASAMEINLNDVWYNKSVSEFKNGSYSQALQNINKSLQQNPNDDAYWDLKVLIFRTMRKYDSALYTLDEALQINSSNSQALNDKGLLEAGYLHDYNRSIQSFDRAIALDPTNAKTYYNKGLILESMKNYDEALQNFQQAVKLAPSFTTAWNHEGFVLKALNRDAEAKIAFSMAGKS